jgi:hypothetical protein
MRTAVRLALMVTWLYPGQMRAPEASGDEPVVDPPYLYPDYRSTILRAPARPLTVLRRSLTEATGPLLGEGRVRERRPAGAEHAR